MADRPSLSKAEMEVTRSVWDIGPATVRQIHESVSESREIGFSTVQTYLRRIEKKGYVNSRLDGRSRVYSARTRARTVIRETVDDLVNRLFGGDAMPLMRHLIEDRNIDSVELAELRGLIERLEKER